VGRVLVINSVIHGYWNDSVYVSNSLNNRVHANFLQQATRRESFTFYFADEACNE
jgi:hypothetical protein